MVVTALNTGQPAAGGLLLYEVGTADVGLASAGRGDLVGSYPDTGIFFLAANFTWAFRCAAHQRARGLPGGAGDSWIRNWIHSKGGRYALLPYRFNSVPELCHPGGGGFFGSDQGYIS